MIILIVRPDNLDQAFEVWGLWKYESPPLCKIICTILSAYLDLKMFGTYWMRVLLKYVSSYQLVHTPIRNHLSLRGPENLRGTYGLVILGEGPGAGDRRSGVLAVRPRVLVEHSGTGWRQ
jgi:hypothetical protein